MLFISHIFIFLFLPLTLAGYIVAGRRWGRGVTVAWLVAASLVFYGYWKIIYVPVLVGSVVFNFGAGHVITRLAAAGASERKRKLTLAAGIVLDLVLLGYFKYFNFFVDATNELAGSHWSVERVVLPLAISFHTFQQIGYLVDTYRGHTGKYSFPQYVLFVVFFPQLIAGPIIKQSDTLPQLRDEGFYQFSHANLAPGLALFILGMFKKVVIADFLMRYADPAFILTRTGQPVYFFEAWGAAFAYTLQLYFDFSGYSEMAIGLGRMFGVRLPLNFKSPFQTGSIPDIWRHWHRTLHRFLRDYLYIPLGGNRKGWWRRAGNAMFTMLIGGIWHGAGWTYVLFGGLHAVYMFITLVWRTALGAWGIKPEEHTAWRAVAQVLTFIAFAVGLMVFRADNLESVYGMLAAMFGFRGFVPPELTGPDLAALRISNRVVFDMGGYGWVLALTAWCWLAPNTYQFMREHPVGLAETEEPAPGRAVAWLRFRPGWAWAVILAAMALLATMKAGQPSPFIYFQF